MVKIRSSLILRRDIYGDHNQQQTYTEIRFSVNAVPGNFSQYDIMYYGENYMHLERRDAVVALYQSLLKRRRENCRLGIHML